MWADAGVYRWRVLGLDSGWLLKVELRVLIGTEVRDDFFVSFLRRGVKGMGLF